MKWWKITYKTIIVLFALAGLFFTGTYLALQFKLTNDKGAVDSNNRYFDEIKDKYNQSFKKDTSKTARKEYEVLHRALILNKYWPKNAELIIAAYQMSGNEKEALRMIDAAELHLQNNKAYLLEVAEYNKKLASKSNTDSTGSIYEWMNIAEWTDFKFAVSKDKTIIDSVAKQTGVEPRLIVSVLVGEQIRLFNSK